MGLRRKAVALAATGFSLVLFLGATPALADEPHNPSRSAHPVRILAYVVHPVGVLLDTLIFRPAHWLVNHETLARIFGHHDE